MRENQFLRERVDALEFQKMDEDQRCATPNCSDGQLERPTKKEADRPPKTPKEAETTKGADGQGAETTKEADRPPDGSGTGSQRSKEAADPHSKEAKASLEIHQLRSPKSRWSFWP